MNTQSLKQIGDYIYLAKPINQWDNPIGIYKIIGVDYGNMYILQNLNSKMKPALKPGKSRSSSKLTKNSEATLSQRSLKPKP
jgi:hypothetical protein